MRRGFGMGRFNAHCRVDAPELIVPVYFVHSLLVGLRRISMSGFQE